MEANMNDIIYYLADAENFRMYRYGFQDVNFKTLIEDATEYFQEEAFDFGEWGAGEKEVVVCRENAEKNSYVHKRIVLTWDGCGGETSPSHERALFLSSQGVRHD
tara:strand:- start:24209 stop:24523 length:315 start_codon:yes stop_codon:yes gene_type:complete